MKKVLSIFLAMMILTSAFLLVSCGKDEKKQDSLDNEQNSVVSQKQIPVYQGMTITSTKSISALSYSNGKGEGGKDGFDYDKDNGNHNGHFKGDHTGKDEEIDEENPYPDNNENENIEEEIKSSLEVIGSPTVLYYTEPNTDIYINIHISNPDNFEILSFTLNGKKYSSYMFEDGSDMETIVLKYNVGSSVGIVEYTIDAIKYVDGTEIKDVLIDGNKTVMAGIKTENQVVANVTGVDIGTNDISFNVNIKDNDSLIAFSDGALKAVLYDGFSIVSEKDLALGSNDITFDNLKTNTLYQYAIIGYYDDLAGSGFGMNLLYKDAFYTDSVVLFYNIVIGQEDISFGFLWHENHQGKSLSALKLYKGETFFKDLTANVTTVNDLLSNTTYKLVAEYTNADKTETIYLEFTTFAKATPEISVINPTKTQTSVGFEIAETDTDNLGAITKIELVHANGTVVADSLDVRSFTGLLSNNSYTVKVTYVYNLNDGAGDKTVVKELAITTLAKATPEISVINPTKTQTSVGFEIAETDTDNLGAITKIELVHANGTVVADSLDVRSFTGLLSNNSYTVKVTYLYNLNDGAGDKTVVKELAITTLAKATPEISVINPTKTQTSVGFEIAETDTDNVGAITKIELVHANGTVVADSLDVRSFTGLLSNNSYTVKVTYLYNLHNGEGSHTVTKELAITTEAKTTPSFVIKNEEINTDIINAEYDVTDVDNVLASYKVELYKDDTLVEENAEKNITFTSLSYYTDYTVRITFTYDLNNGNGVQTSTVEKTYKTLPFIDVIKCDVTNTSAVSEGETIFMSVNLNNPLNMSIESVVINGVTYGVTGASTKNNIFVEIIYNGQFAGGDTYLKIDKINAKINSTSLTVEPQTELADNVFINGKLEVLKIELVNEAFELIEWAFPSDKVYVLITLNNPTGYNLDSLVQSGSEISSSGVTSLIRIDDNHWYYEITKTGTGWNYRSLDSLSYSRGDFSKTITYSEMTTACFYKVASDEIKYITTPDDLKNMDDSYYYELTNDINLAGLEWLGNDFDGVFEGNGYVIKNMSFVGTIRNTAAYLGLFSSGSGVIQNVSIVEATVTAEITANYGYHYEAYYGGLVASSGRLNIHECSVDEFTTVSIKNLTGYACAGGLIGSADEAIITNSVNNGDVSSSSYYYNYNDYYDSCAGGLIGSVGDAIITNSVNNGDVSSSYYAGGLIGSASGDSTITNSVNNGDVSTTTTNYSYAGGLIGSASGDSTITNSVNNGDVSTTTTTDCSYVGGLIGSAGDAIITNSVNNGDVSTTKANFSSDAGGLIGYVSGNAIITNSVNNGDVSSSSPSSPYVGGLIGRAFGDAIITNSVNNGDITSSSSSSSSPYLGGLIGSADAIITNSVNNGDITSSYSSSLYLGGLIGRAFGGAIITNSYSLTWGKRGENGLTCTVDQLNSKDFYTETLGWSEDIWDLSELDIENGKYPELKH